MNYYRTSPVVFSPLFYKEKARIQLAKAWQKVRRARDDFVHKASTSLDKEAYTLIVFENLNIKNMVKNLT